MQYPTTVSALGLGSPYPEILTEGSTSMTSNSDDRRAHYRLPIRVPIFVKGIDKQGSEYFELTHTIDVSASGACFLSRRPLEIMADLLVSIPAPVDINSNMSENYDFKFPAKIVRIDNGLANSNNRVSVRFAKPLYEKS